MKVLVINAGSSSLKYKIFDMNNREKVLAHGSVERIGLTGGRLEHENTGASCHAFHNDLANHEEAFKLIFKVITNEKYGCLQDLSEIAAVGHRVVHGGENLPESALVDDAVKAAILQCFELAPLHNPANLLGVEVAQQLMPYVPHVVVFDTAFHQTMTPSYYMYALPWDFYERFKIRKYGFHGTSHKYVSHRAAEMLGRPYEKLKLITLHLGNGASVAAIKDGKVLDTSMGFTPLEGLVMGTRSGDLDPYVVVFLMKKLDLTPDEVCDYLNKKSGCAGLSGISSDLRDIKNAALKGSEKAQITIDVFVNRVKAYIGNYIAKMNGCDAIIFTAGIGENAITIRRKICENMDYLGIILDTDKNRVRRKEKAIHADNSHVKILIIPTDEELVIARDTVRLAQIASTAAV